MTETQHIILATLNKAILMTRTSETSKVLLTSSEKVDIQLELMRKQNTTLT